MERGHQTSAKMGYTAQITWGDAARLSQMKKAELSTAPHTANSKDCPRPAKAAPSGHHKSAYAVQSAHGKPVKRNPFNSA